MLRSLARKPTLSGPPTAHGKEGVIFCAGPRANWQIAAFPAKLAPRLLPESSPMTDLR